MAGLKGRFNSGEWLDRRNPYRTDAVASIRRDIGHLRRKKVAEYIAVSAILHCFDGWSFLGRALQAEMASDPDAARHLGYYAELRAAMSLLASEGIGVFDKDHVVMDAKGGCHPIKGGGGTHGFAWEALETWADGRATDVLFRVITVQGFPLSEWLQQFRSTGVQAIATHWLKSWGLDIRRILLDRDARNTASYRPVALETSGPRPIIDVVRSVAEMWTLFEPGGSDAFQHLDRQLLRRSLEFVFRASHPHERSVRQASAQYRSRVENMLNSLTLTEVARTSVRRFLDPCVTLSRASLPADASGEVTPRDVDHSKQVLARATLLLRVATGCARELVDSTGPDPHELFQFWWSSPSVRRGLWSESRPPRSFVDLWSDAEDALDAVRGWADYKGPHGGSFEFWDEHAKEAAILATPERVCLMGVGV